MEQPATPSLDIRLEAERIVIGNAFHDADWLATAAKDAQPDLFLEPRHRILWRAIRETHQPGQPADEVSVMAHLQQEGTLEQVGGYASIAEFPNALLGPAPFAARHLESFKEDAKKAKVVEAMRRLSGMAHVLNAAEMADEARRIAALAEPDRKPGDNGAIEFPVRELLGMDRATDPNALIGNRWLCRGGSCLIVGTTGSGKSALCTQLALGWALGQEPFGLKSRKGPLRSVILQAENDAQDIAEGLQDIMSGMGIPSSADVLVSQIADRVHFYREAVRTGEEFGKLIRDLVLRHSADLLWVDPLLAYAGINVSDQEQASHFLRHILQPVLQETGVVLMALHHTTKPKSAKDAAPTDIDSLAYAGGGSAEFANWFRAVCVLQKDPDSGDLPHYNLRLAKRGGRAGVKDPATGAYTRSIPLRHSRDAGVVCWERRTSIDPSGRTVEVFSDQTLGDP